MSPVEWLSRRLLLVGGKGGVGKTTCAAALAHLAAAGGQKTLLISTDPAHSTSDLLDARLGEEPTEVADRLSALEIDPEKATRRYIDQVRAQLDGTNLRPELRAEVDRQVEMARVSPGAQEAALFDRVADLVQESKTTYDLVVFDTAPTGHTLRLLTLPELMQAWVDGLLQRRRHINRLSAMWRNMTVGENRDEEDPVEAALLSRRRKFYKLRQVLLDPEATAFIFVLNPERLPILETAKALELLSGHGVPIAGLIVNRVLPDAARGEFFEARKEQEAAYLQEIETRFAARLCLRLPLLPHDVSGPVGLAELATALGRALER